MEDDRLRNRRTFTLRCCRRCTSHRAVVRRFRVSHSSVPRSTASASVQGMHLKLKLLSGRGAVVHRMELGDRCLYVKLRETVSALTTEPLDLYYVDSEQGVCKVATDDELKASFEARRSPRVATFIGAPRAPRPASGPSL